MTEFKVTDEELEAYSNYNDIYKSIVINPDSDWHWCLRDICYGKPCDLKKLGLLLQLGLIEIHMVEDQHFGLKLTQHGIDSIKYLEEGYCWDAERKIPLVDYSAGYHSINEMVAGYFFKGNLFRKHYKANKEEVDVYISLALILK